MTRIANLLHLARPGENGTAFESRQFAGGNRSGSQLGTNLLRGALGPFTISFCRHELKKVENFCSNILGKSGCFRLELLSFTHASA
jgi:hypothetical protein